MVLLIGAVCLAFAPAPLPHRNSERSELARLQGEWRRARCVQYGQEYEPSVWRVLVVGDRLRYVAGDRLTAEYALRLYPTGRPPRIDFRDVAVEGRVLHGVYRLEGDVLTVCTSSWGMERPIGLDDLRRGHFLTEFRRVRR
jgi:uncharacterized protein (TIGR03067 family)